jgi:hypothetical protein
MVIPIFNNNPRAPMRDNVTRSKTTYSTRNAGGDGTGEETRVGSFFIRGPVANGLDHRGYSRDGCCVAITYRLCWDQGHSSYVDCWRLYSLAEDVCREKGFTRSGIEFHQWSTVSRSFASSELLADGQTLAMRGYDCSL